MALFSRIFDLYINNPSNKGSDTSMMGFGVQASFRLDWVLIVITKVNAVEVAFSKFSPRCHLTRPGYPTNGFILRGFSP